MQKNTKWIGVALLGLALILMAWQSQDQSRRMNEWKAQQAKIEAVKTGEAARKSASAKSVTMDAAATANTSTSNNSGSEITPTTVLNPNVAQSVAAKPVRHLEDEKLQVLENEFLKVTFTSRGGAIRSVAFKEYPAVQGVKEPCVLQAPAELPFLALNFSDKADGADLSNYSLISKTADSITFARTVATGITLERKYTLTTPAKERNADGYLINQTLSWHNVSAYDLQLPAYTMNVGTAVPDASDPQNLFLDFGSYNGKDAHFIHSNYFKGGGFLFWTQPPQSVYQTIATATWAAVDNKFFSIICTPKAPAMGISSRPIMVEQLPPPNPLPLGGGEYNGAAPRTPSSRSDDSTSAVGFNPRQPSAPQAAPQEAIAGNLMFAGPLVNAGSTLVSETQNYFGPKEYARIASLGEHQDEVMQWGWPIFAFFSKLFISMLNWLAGAFHNYGVAIIILTLLIRAAMWPFTAAAAQASKKMAVVQPMLKEVQTKYKDHPERLQKETLKIFQENSVNPLAGCLPALLQIPVFIGFFYMLRSAAELRFEHFLWIRDLSMPDTIAHIGGFPINPLPVIMLVTMYYQMKLTPSAGDPEQQKVMQFTPFIFSFLLYNFSAGLTLYWTLSNLISIIQQLMVNNQKQPPGSSAGADGVIDVKAERVR